MIYVLWRLFFLALGAVLMYFGIRILEARDECRHVRERQQPDFLQPQHKE